jgi:hypothetical protein
MAREMPRLRQSNHAAEQRRAQQNASQYRADYRRVMLAAEQPAGDQHHG